MARPVIAYHLIITAYGFWLSNDPRGSWSEFVRSWELARFGIATKTNNSNSLAHNSHDREHRLLAKTALARPPVVFSGQQCQAIGAGFAHYTRRTGCIILPCSILPTHTHLVVMRMTYSIEQIANLLKGAATAELMRRDVHPFAHQPYRNGKLPTPWARHEWSCFLDDNDDIQRSIAYTQSNPQKEGLPPQRWQCVTPFPA